MVETINYGRKRLVTVRMVRRAGLSGLAGTTTQPRQVRARAAQPAREPLGECGPLRLVPCERPARPVY